MDSKKPNIQGIKASSVKNIKKILDKNEQNDKEPQTPKIALNPGSFSQATNMGFPAPQQAPQPNILSLQLLTKNYDDYERARVSNKQLGSLKSFSYNTFHGLYKDYNEDKIIVVNQIKKPASSKMKAWPKISYFGIFDGHGGEGCAEYLKENFLNYLIENKNFPFDIKLSLIETFEKIEEAFFKEKCGTSLELSDRSGSCALVSIIFDNKIYIANLGDSRAIMSVNGGTKVKSLTNDHKPNNPREFERAIKNGSKIYADDNDDPDRDVSKLIFIKDKSEFEKYKKTDNKKDDIVFREYPSDLAVMRTVGDIKAKRKEYGGNPGTIINKPDIFIYDINSNDDFIVLGCDGIYDDLSNQEICNAAWFIFKNESKEKNYDIHELTQDACDLIIKYALEKQTSDNLSCIVIGLDGLEKFLKNKSTKEKVNNSLNNFKKGFKRSATIK
jgi:protein phosphatase 2C family protein 2/3